MVFKKGVVLGLIEDVDDGRLQHPWVYRSYYELLPVFKSTFDTLVEKGELKDRDCFIIKQYLEFLDALLSLLSPFKKNLGESEWGFGSKLFAEIRDLGILEFVKKMQAHAFSEYVRSEWLRNLPQKYAIIEISTPYTFGADAEVLIDVLSLCRASTVPVPKVQIQIILRNDEIARRVKIKGKRKNLNVLRKWNDEQKLCKERVYHYLTPRRILKRDFSSVSKQLQREVRKAVDIIPEILCEMGIEPKCRTRTETRR